MQWIRLKQGRQKQFAVGEAKENMPRKYAFLIMFIVMMSSPSTLFCTCPKCVRTYYIRADGTAWWEFDKDAWTLTTVTSLPNSLRSNHTLNEASSKTSERFLDFVDGARRTCRIGSAAPVKYVHSTRIEFTSAYNVGVSHTNVDRVTWLCTYM